MRSSGGSAGAELRIICGPTAAGKSALALALAERHGLTIVSADSRQVYRGFDIGTAKPGTEERRRVPHVGIDVADAAERWSVAHWRRAVLPTLDADPARMLVVGGTGLYLRFLVDPLFEEPPLDPARRTELRAELSSRSVESLRHWVRELDPALAHLGRAQLERAVEVAQLTGRRLSDLQAESAKSARRPARWLLVDPGDALQQRIGRRLDDMLAGGWVDEASALDVRVPEGAPAWQACGYRTVRALARGEIDAAPARETILIATRQYAKRQRTWFRHQLAGARVTRLDPADSAAASAVERWWTAGDHA